MAIVIARAGGLGELSISKNMPQAEVRKVNNVLKMELLLIRSFLTPEHIQLPEGWAYGHYRISGVPVKTTWKSNYWYFIEIFVFIFRLINQSNHDYRKSIRSVGDLRNGREQYSFKSIVLKTPLKVGWRRQSFWFDHQRYWKLLSFQMRPKMSLSSSSAAGSRCYSDTSQRLFWGSERRDCWSWYRNISSSGTGVKLRRDPLIRSDLWLAEHYCYRWRWHVPFAKRVCRRC